MAAKTKKPKLTVRQRLEAVVQEVEVYEAQKRTDKEAQKSAKEEVAKVPVIIDLATTDDEFSINLINEAARCKSAIGSVKSQKGFAYQLDKATEALLQMQVEHEADGLQYGDIKFVASVQGGRETFSQQKMRDALLLKGVDLDTIDLCMDLATSHGEPFAVRKLTIPDIDD